MVSTAFIYLAGIVVSTVVTMLSVLPGNNGFPDEVDSAVSYFGDYMGQIDFIVPLQAVHDVVIFIVTFELLLISFWLIRWVMGYLPVVGGK